jgi:hypothetical protein
VAQRGIAVPHLGRGGGGRDCGRPTLRWHSSVRQSSVGTVRLRRRKRRPTPPGGGAVRCFRPPPRRGEGAEEAAAAPPQGGAAQYRCPSPWKGGERRRRLQPPHLEVAQCGAIVLRRDGVLTSEETADVATPRWLRSLSGCAAHGGTLVSAWRSGGGAALGDTMIFWDLRSNQLRERRAA